MATISLIDLCNCSSPSNWTRWLLSGRLHFSLDKRIGPGRYLVSWKVWARCLIYWIRWSGQPSTRESPENFVWHTFDKVAEQGEATAIIRWEIFSNRPRMFKSIEKARKVFILLNLAFCLLLNNFIILTTSDKVAKEGESSSLLYIFGYFTSFFLFWYISSYRQCTTTLSTYLFNQPVEMYQMANLQNRQANVSRLIACETELNILNYLNMQGIH